ncbi:hypothetical protein NA78x_003475 [Anatilimnocola sp. NA78]|uniref:hypothetical protein n=1 Tax=Anatilimnocola sp. NA78 TaxID=3415683 RepID=UPI003CE525E7
MPHPLIILLLAALFPALARADDEAANAAELARLAGRFERTMKNEAGTEFRVVQDIVGDQSTVTTYDDIGQVVTAHTSSFKVEQRGGIRVLTFFNFKATAGPDKGRESPTPRSFIYRLEGDNLAEVWGLLAEDKSPPRMHFWKRAK